MNQRILRNLRMNLLREKPKSVPLESAAEIATAIAVVDVAATGETVTKISSQTLQKHQLLSRITILVKRSENLATVNLQVDDVVEVETVAEATVDDLTTMAILVNAMIDQSETVEMTVTRILSRSFVKKTKRQRSSYLNSLITSSEQWAS
jgi:hypothetical protein